MMPHEAATSRTLSILSWHLSCHGETRSPCPFRSIAEARVLNLVVGSAVQWPELATGYGHVWRLVGKNCNPFVNGTGLGGAGQRRQPRQRIGAAAGCRPHVHLARWPGTR